MEPGIQSQYAMLCDTVNKTADGKINLVGVFDKILVQQFPATHLLAWVYARGVIPATLPEKQHALTFHWEFPDGRKTSAVGIPVEIPEFIESPLTVDFVVPVALTTFTMRGDYFAILTLDDNEIFRVPLSVEPGVPG